MPGAGIVKIGTMIEVMNVLGVLNNDEDAESPPAPWQDALAVIGDRRVTLGPQASQQWLDAPEHLAMVLARYRAAAALIGDARSVLEIGCGEGIGARILARGRKWYTGIDSDAAAIGIAIEHQRDPDTYFGVEDALDPERRNGRYDAVVTLDVIEHIPNDQEAVFMARALSGLAPHGVMVIGTPNQAFEHLQSPQSRAGHVNLLGHDYLHTLMSRYFHVVVMLGMQDTSIHMGHPEARHYHLAAGYGPK